jgi:hypothetical protein
MKNAVYKVTVLGLGQDFVGGVDVSSITDQLYCEDVAWEKARTVLRAIDESQLEGHVFVTRCSASVTEEYDVPVMLPDQQ